jgi:hypothetical protein
MNDRIRSLQESLIAMRDYKIAMRDYRIAKQKALNAIIAHNDIDYGEALTLLEYQIANNPLLED